MWRRGAGNLANVSWSTLLDGEGVAHKVVPAVYRGAGPICEPWCQRPVGLHFGTVRAVLRLPSIFIDVDFLFLKVVFIQSQMIQYDFGKMYDDIRAG